MRRFAIEDAVVQAGRRVGLCCCFAIVWSLLIRLLTGGPVTPVPVLLLAAGMTAGLAAAYGEHPMTSRLNRWDEAVALVGVAALISSIIRHITS